MRPAAQPYLRSLEAESWNTSALTAVKCVAPRDSCGPRRVMASVHNPLDLDLVRHSALDGPSPLHISCAGVQVALMCLDHRSRVDLVSRFACGFREAGGKDGDIDGATWDPENPLNAGGVHGDCPPQRVDHVLRRTSGPMADWRVVSPCRPSSLSACPFPQLSSSH